jgi:FK506-binding protein 4/5
MLSIKSRYVWGGQGFKKFNLEPNTDVTYEVTLKSFEKVKEGWQFNSLEKLNQCELWKNKGNSLLGVIIKPSFIRN